MVTTVPQSILKVVNADQPQLNR